MNYIYDIILNLNPQPYDFFEWQLNDNIVHVKKIPLIKISSKDLFNIKNNKVIMYESFLKTIKRKTSFFNKCKYEYACLLSDGHTVLGIACNSVDEYTLKSNLLIDEEIEVLELMDILDYEEIGYKIIEREKTSLITRNQKVINNYIEKQINDILNIEKLKYIYYECFNDIETDINKIKDKLLHSLKNDKNNVSSKLYNILKLTSAKK